MIQISHEIRSINYRSDYDTSKILILKNKFEFFLYSMTSKIYLYTKLIQKRKKISYLDEMILNYNLDEIQY